MRRKSLAKYNIAPSTNSPNDALNTPLPFVSWTGLSLSSGNSVRSSPTERECTQRKFGHNAKTSLNSGREADQLKSTRAPEAAGSNASAEFPTTMSAPESLFSRIAICGSDGSAKTRIVSFFIGTGTVRRSLHHNGAGHDHQL